MAGLPDTDAVRLRRVLARMPARLRGARRHFRSLTGLTAVTSLRSAAENLLVPGSLSPPVHPRCAERLDTASRSPCEAQWRHHVLVGRRSRSVHSHTCPLGLRCSCVPIYLGGTFVGIAKLVADPDLSAARFSEATEALALAVSLSCHESYMAVLRDELDALKQRARAPSRGVSRAGSSGPHDVTATNGAIVGRALDYLHAHARDHELSLRTVAAAVGCNDKYLSHVFTQAVGQRMHVYLVGLRVDEARRAILRTDRPFKQIAFDVGFGDAGQMARAFLRHVGVTPSAYREIFSGR